MQRPSRRISVKDCYEILKLDKNADLDALKSAYRQRAFELHPDLNPGNPEAGRQFQQLNEAYVALSAVITPASESAKKAEKKAEERAKADKAKAEASKAKAEAEKAKKEADKAKRDADKAEADKAKAEAYKARSEAYRAEARAKADMAKAEAARVKAEAAKAKEEADKAASEAKSRGGAQAGPSATGAAEPSQSTGPAESTGPTEQDATSSGRRSEAQSAYTEQAEQDVLRDLLNDPFARRVFEDIYSELNHRQAGKQASTEKPRAPEDRTSQEKRERASTTLHQGNIAWGTPKWNMDFSKGVKGVVKDWLRRQIDEEQSLTLPAARLAPGRRVRLQIRQGFSGELRAVEITLPPDFAVGKAVRLRGLGKRVGPWQGDLYLTFYTE